MDSQPRAARTSGALEALTLVAVTVLAANFTRLGQFGLYEDDYWSIAPHLSEPLSRLGSLALHHFTHWPTGRPLNHLLPAVLSAVGSSLGGLTGVYVLSAAWLTLNGLLVYLAARRLISKPGALIASVLYLLFPADSTKLLLTHSAHVQGAMTFLLLGSWLWLLGGWRRALSYPVAALSLLAYESAFLPFLVLPLFVPVERSRLLRAWGTHLGAIGLFVGLDAWARMVTGDSRALAAARQLGESVRRVVTSLWLGPMTSVTSLFRSSVAGLRALDPLAVLSAMVFVLALLTVIRGTSNCAEGAEAAGPSDAQPGLRWWRLLLAAMIAWSVSYALSIVNYPPTQTVGRLTSSHVAAGWPAALGVGVLFEQLYGIGRVRRRLALIVTAAWLASLVGYQHELQRGYVRAWEEERRFWKELTVQAPDVGAGWAVIVIGPPRAGTPVILSTSWADHYAHRQIYTPGFDPAGPAFAHLGFQGSQIAFEHEGDSWRWRPEFWGGPWLHIDRSRLALFEDDHGTLRRVEELQTSAGILRSTAPLPTEARTEWPDTPVSRLLFPEAVPLK